MCIQGLINKHAKLLQLFDYDKYNNEYVILVKFNFLKRNNVLIKQNVDKNMI